MFFGFGLLVVAFGLVLVLVQESLCGALEALKPLELVMALCALARAQATPHPPLAEALPGAVQRTLGAKTPRDRETSGCADFCVEGTPCLMPLFFHSKRKPTIVLGVLNTHFFVPGF